MSTAASWDAAPVTGRPAGPARPARPELYLVPTGRDAMPKPTLRISRFGRLVGTVGLLLAAATLVLSLVGPPSSGVAVDRTVRVGAGQTLSEVAVRELPQLPVAEGVAQLQLANELSSSQVHAGQELKIPRVG